MYSIVKIDLIKKFLLNYGIDYDLIDINFQSIIVILSNILFLVFWFIVAYILYRVFIKIFC